MTRYGMAVDMVRCCGCNRCAMACKVEHNLPGGVLWNKGIVNGREDFMLVPDTDENGNLYMDFRTIACQHCDEPSCLAACPTGATAKRDDGIVTVNYEECIGCDSCIKACPYDGVRTHISNPSFIMDWKLGDEGVPDVKEGIVSKCTFCVERLDRGESPRCIDLCFAHARYFGDLDDPESEISRVLSSREHEQLLTSEGTGPNVYFLQ